MLRISIHPLFSSVPLGYQNRWRLIVFRGRRRAEITSSFTSRRLSSFGDLNRRRSREQCDNINNTNAGGARLRQEKAYELEEHFGQGELPVTIQKNHFARVWQRVILWIQNEYREEALPWSEFLFTSVIRWIKGPDAPARKRSSGWQWDGGREGWGRGWQKVGRGGGKDAAEIPVSYDKRDNGLSNYPVERLNRATMKFVLSASFFSFS